MIFIVQIPDHKGHWTHHFAASSIRSAQEFANERVRDSLGCRFPKPARVVSEDGAVLFTSWSGFTEAGQLIREREEASR